ncbi:MAG TPA: hypothetical protein VMC07_00595 [Candidatus Omnitrophota bacterium]|nr:hypothetical protein [Candidatus Omnitrophota bacterium]
MTIKTLKDMMKDADKAFLGGAFPIVFLDTSAIIDICKSAKEEEMKQKGKSNMLLQEVYADHFLMNFAGKYQTIISPRTYSEITRHYCVRFNGNTKEIQDVMCPLVDKFSTDYERLKEFVFDKVHDDRDRYNVYWATKLSCADNGKKDLEGFSEVDREILDNAVLFSKYFYKDGCSARPVAIFSSDEHISKGVEMLNRMGYDNLTTISSRIKHGR